MPFEQILRAIPLILEKRSTLKLKIPEVYIGNDSFSQRFACGNLKVTFCLCYFKINVQNKFTLIFSISAPKNECCV